VKLRTYHPDDQDACMALFQDNTPHFFAEHEVAEYADFLERLPCPYFVVEDSGAMVGGGGIVIDEQEHRAGLAWGLVDRQRHRQGIGRFLLLARLDWLIRRHPEITIVELDTSQHSYGFFATEGFVITKVSENWYAEGLHRYDMRLMLDDEQRSRITQTFAGLSREFEL
jgi:GNAT superfamily N-acetyltransferase